VTVTVRAGRRQSTRGIVAAGLVSLILLAMLAAWVSPERVIGASEKLMHVIRELGVLGGVVFAMVQVLIAVSGILPASLLGVGAGAIYGLVPGFLLVAASTMAGAILSFFLSRSLFRTTVERLVSRRLRLRNLDAQISQEGWKLVCLLRISPIMPFSATSIALGLSGVALRDYTIGTLASLPALCGYVLIGALADTGISAWATGASPLHWALLGVGGLATLILIARFGQIAMKLRLGSRPAADLEFTSDQGRPDNLKID
jgi:uncharacterized membrane protein YdjX (TVP38/TMEM64 family)